MLSTNHRTGNRAFLLPLRLTAIALCLGGVLNATHVGAASIRENQDADTQNQIRECQKGVHLFQEQVDDFRHRPFSVATTVTIEPLTISSSCASVTTSTSIGLTSSTSDRTRQATAFIRVQGEALWQEIASGQGERLVALASLMGCPRTSIGAFGSSVQAAFEQIVAGPASTPETVLSGVRHVISEDLNLSVACSAAKVPRVAAL